MSPTNGEAEITGDFYEGAYGPSIIIALASPRAAEQLKAVVLHVSGGSGPLDLENQPSVQLCHGLRIRMTMGDNTEKVLAQVGDSPAFEWSCPSEVWREVVEMLDPFIAGKNGHQYLNDGVLDDALIEATHGEGHQVQCD